MLEFLTSIDLTCALIVAVFFLLLEYRPPWWRRPPGEKRTDVELIPGPRALPIIGTSWYFALSGRGLPQLHEYYRELYAKYGPVIKEETFGNVAVINLFDKLDIEKVLRSGGKYPLRPPAEAVSVYRASRPDRYSTIGLVNEQGPAWHFLRTTLTPTLTSPRTTADFAPTLSSICDDWCALLAHHLPPTRRLAHLDALVDRLALELTCALVLGRRLGLLLPGEPSSVAHALGAAVRQHFLATRDTYFGLPFWKLLPTAAYRRLVRAEEAIYQLATQLIASADEATRDSAVFRSVVGAPIDEREKVAAIVDFISAGIHTMKNSLLFLLALVGRDEQVQAKLCAEGETADAYAKACLTESFRLHPTAGSLGRILDAGLEVGGFALERGAVVVCHCGAACRDPKNFDEPEAFRPERWIGEEGKVTTMRSGSFLMAPFGAGKRICPGKRFVEGVLPTILKRTAEAFKITAEPIEVVFEFLMTPKGPITMTFEERC